MIGSVAATTVGLIVGIEKEEELLEREFKDEWRGYTKRVPYRIIPFVF
jgi:protein-S-isoprenylcysteine O-methyltransferase Ste14